MRLSALLIVCVLATACSKPATIAHVASPTGPSTPPYNTDVDVAEMMAHVMNPGAQAFWRGYGEVLTNTGWSDISAKTDEEWEKVESGAATVVAATNVLLIPGYVREPVADWNRYAVEVAKLAVAGKAGADKHDRQVMYNIGGQLDEACDACHHQFAAGK